MFVLYKNEANKNAAELCPDGKLNLSAGLMKAVKFGRAAAGRSRRISGFAIK